VSGDDIVQRLRNWDDGRVSTHYEGCWDSHPVCVILLAADAIEARDAEIARLRGNQRAVVALARTVLGKSEHPVERSPWIDVIHMMDEEARTNGSASATNAGGPT
jgi:hypothetical protein